METKRIELYNRFKTDAEDHKMSDVFRKKYPNYNTWDETNFIDKNATNAIWNKTIEIFEKVDFNTFLKTYVCDKDWAKNEEYCKTSPKQGEWVEIEDGNKSKFLQEFPCIASLIRGTGKQSSTSEGLVLAMPITDNGNRCWVYMTDSADPNIQSKYDGLIVNRDTKDRGRFECEGGKISSDDDNPQLHK